MTHPFVFISSEYSKDDTLRSHGLLYQGFEAWRDGLPCHTLTVSPAVFPPRPGPPNTAFSSRA